MALIYQYVGIDDHNIFLTKTVKSGNAIPWKISENYNQSKIITSEKQKIESYKTIAFIVIQNDSIQYEEYWDTYSDTSLTNAFSATKSIISLLIGIAIDEGKIKSINQKISDFFPELKGKYSGEVSIKNLLTMSSGLNWDESYGSPFSKTTQAYYGSNLKKLIFDLEINEKPGEKFKYLSGTTQLLAFVISKATGKSVSEYASEKLWIPIGAQHDALWYLDKANGMEKSYCCFTSNARDFAKIGQLVLDSGRVNGNQIISENYISQLSQPDTFLIDEKNQKVDYYGLHWWIIDYKGFKITYARGILGQYIFVIPQINAVVVRLGHKRDDNYEKHHPLDVYLYLDAAFNLLNK
jgi:CubicO group peptidase (beta-lactamase class C family)